MEDSVYFAQLDDNNTVVAVYTINYRDCCDYLGNKSENIGIGVCQQRYGSNTVWKETFKTGIRGNFAGLGYVYMNNVETLGVASTDIFINKKPFPSWKISKTTAIWESPLGPSPNLTEDEKNNGYYYVWDEDLYQTDNTKGWTFPPTVL